MFPSEFEVNKNTPKILIILLNTMIELLDVPLVEEAQHFFLELPASFAGYDLHQFDLFVDRFLHDAVELVDGIFLSFMNSRQSSHSKPALRKKIPIEIMYFLTRTLSPLPLTWIVLLTNSH